MLNLAIIDDYHNAALTSADWSPLTDHVTITVFTDHASNEEALIARLAPFDIVCIMRERTAFPTSVISRLPKLKHLFTSGPRNASIDLAAAKAAGIVVTGSPTLGYPTAELTGGLVLALARNIVAEATAVHQGRWGVRLGVGLHGKTFGIVGLGRVGESVAAFAQAFGMQVIAWSQNLTPERCVNVGAAYVSKDALFELADVVSVHLKLSQRTTEIVGAAEFDRMKQTALFVNTSRAEIVHTMALCDALRSGQIAAAACDVFEDEPLAPNSPLLDVPNLLITPHLGYVTIENYQLFFRSAVENIRAWINGQLINEVM